MQARSSESRYIRTGHGTKVLLLLPRQRTAWLNGSLVRSLAEQYCVVVPEIPEAVTTLEGWLMDFLDGTGFDGDTIVAEVELEPVLARAASSDERIGRIVFVDGAAPPASIADVLLKIGATCD